MKTIVSIFTVASVLIISLLSYSGSADAANDDFVGEISAVELHAQYPDFNNAYKNYAVSDADVALLSTIETPIEIKVLFGTWCHDSVREIPRLSKLLARANNSYINSTLIAVDRQKTADKSFKLQYTPTIIVYQNNLEVGRIIETPKISLAQDIINLISG